MVEFFYDDPQVNMKTGETRQGSLPPGITVTPQTSGKSTYMSPTHPITRPSIKINYNAGFDYYPEEEKPGMTNLELHRQSLADVRTQLSGMGGTRTGMTLQPSGRISTVTQRTIAPTGMERPKLKLSDFEAPETEEGPLDFQQYMNIRPQRREAERGIRLAMQQENPNVGALYAGQLMRGFSEGISSEAQRATQVALGEKARKEALDYQTALTNWQKDTQTQMNEYNAAMLDYNRGFITESTTYSRDVYGDEGASGSNVANLGIVAPKSSLDMMLSEHNRGLRT